jgi:hypothetical protein
MAKRPFGCEANHATGIWTHTAIRALIAADKLAMLSLRLERKNDKLAMLSLRGGKAD